MEWIAKHPQARIEMLGYIPDMISEADPRPAREQIDANYRHGGGWSSFKGHVMKPNGLQYPGDPLVPLLYEATLRDETIRFYDCAWVAIVQPDGSYDIARID